MTELKAGLRLRSITSDVQVMVVKAPAGASGLSCGGAQMVPSNEDAPSLPIDPAFDEPCLVGKRYVDATQALEVLCVKGGNGTLSLGGETLQQKQAKILPSSD